MKLQKRDGKWIIEDHGRNIIFDTSYDAWQYIFLMKEIRQKAPQVPRSLYPVRHLNPYPPRGCKRVRITRL
jgi:hypothetical protein